VPRSVPLFRLATLLVLLVLLAPPARAEPHLSLSYALYVTGLHVGNLTLRVDNTGDMHLARMAAATRGLLDTIVRYRGTMAASAQMVNGELAPAHYEASYATRRYSRDVLIRFDPATGEVVDVENHKRGEPQEPRVPDELLADTIDPLTALMQLRQALAAAIEEAPMTFHKRVFDGRRRYDLDVVYQERDRARIGGEERDVLRLEITMTAIAGFNRRDLLSGWTDDGERRIEVLVSDDGLFVPLMLATRGGVIASSALLTEICLDAQACPDPG
jgi:hypothetical protein